MIEITEQRYKELLWSELFLQCLENSGVDNWVGFESAQDEFDKVWND